jgi:hypothetical protein
MRAVVIVVATLTCSTWQQITTCAGPDGYRSTETQVAGAFDRQRQSRQPLDDIAVARHRDHHGHIA